MTTNTTVLDTLSLFPDNSNNEISASDMRTFVSSVFGDKEVKAIKLQKSTDIAFNNSYIYEHSIVLIYNDKPDFNGVYLSLLNQPTQLNHLKKLAGIVVGTGGGDLYSDGSVSMDIDYIPINPQDIATLSYVQSLSVDNPYPINTSENFLYVFEQYNTSFDKDFIYDITGRILKINITDNFTIFYVVDFIYDINENIQMKTITDIDGNRVEISYIYDAGNISLKNIVFINI